MTNLFIEEPTYITVQELKDSSTWELSLTSDDNIKIYIVKAHILIDSLIWSYWTKVSETQKYIFPTINDWIPLSIKKATILLSESLYKNRFNLDKFYNIQQEQRRWNSVTYDNSSKSKFQNIHPCLNDEIYIYLKDYFAIDKTKSVFFRT
jgi:hypothetical protein